MSPEAGVRSASTVLGQLSLTVSMRRSCSAGVYLETTEPKAVNGTLLEVRHAR